MFMSDVLMWVAIAGGFVVGLPALWMLSRGLWPGGFAKRSAVARRGIGLSFLLGLIPAAGFIFMLFLTGRRLGPIPGAILSGVLIVWGLNGMAGIASLVGERLWPAGEPWKQTRNGGLVVICCALMPIVGWFLFLPLLAVIGLGVNLRCLFEANPHPAEASRLPADALESTVGTPN
jgi:hypothetical protein